jgi:hypothetical protein
MDKALAQFGPQELEAPSHQAREMAETRHYEALTRLDTLCAAGKAGIRAVVEVHLEAQQYDHLPRHVRNEVGGLEAETYATARENIRNLRYHQ